ncbi:MAG: quinolinate synthase NadA [Clostridia bacterium]|nr:quinolinate synthase NadA [Clostridia bacterium]NCC44382.1 quinolinate synthase NadA [Clostridia bacterium]
MTIKEEIQALKKERNAIILAHYYVPDEVQEIADHIGDSYYLSKTAAATDADVLVLCGVSFMGESAKILNPEKTVLMPDAAADCPMAHMADIPYIERLKKQYDDLAVVCYINSTAELKSHSDVCVTSANALTIVKALPNKNIFFVPDENLGKYIASKVPEKNFLFNDGRCPIHAQLTRKALEDAKSEHPEAKVLIHPECTPDVLALADYIGSTTGIIKYCGECTADSFIICTEKGVFYELNKQNPNKKFYLANESLCCPDMKLITLPKILDVLKNNTNQVTVDANLRKDCLIPLQRMLELSK